MVYFSGLHVPDFHKKNVLVTGKFTLQFQSGSVSAPLQKRVCVYSWYDGDYMVPLLPFSSPQC